MAQVSTWALSSAYGHGKLPGGMNDSNHRAGLGGFSRYSAAAAAAADPASDTTTEPGGTCNTTVVIIKHCRCPFDFLHGLSSSDSCIIHPLLL